MSTTRLNGLTSKEQFWHEHIQQARASNQTLTDYASTRDLSIKCFYNYRSKLRKKGFLEVSQAKSFIKVTPPVSDIGTTIIFPNGIRIQTQCSAGELPDLIKRLMV